MRVVGQKYVLSFLLHSNSRLLKSFIRVYLKGIRKFGSITEDLINLIPLSISAAAVMKCLTKFSCSKQLQMAVWQKL